MTTRSGLAKASADALAARLTAYWRGKGRPAVFTVESVRIDSPKITSSREYCFCVRSNLMGGLPPPAKETTGAAGRRTIGNGA